MTRAVYHLREVCKEYEGRCILEVPDLEIRQGEIFSIIGPNGSGKSTLLRLINFLEPCSAGEIFYDGQLIPYPAPLTLRRQISMVFQRPLLFDRTVLYNVTYGLRLRGQNDRDAIDSLLHDLDLEALADVSVRSLSGGQVQRVALARTLALEPKVLLLDEPTANLDPHTVGITESIIRAISTERRTTVVLVTHNVFQAGRLADRTMMLLNGEVVEVAEPSKILENPGDPRTRAFVRGEMVY
jgi:tungstate transport system ATP-binding protein